MFEHSSILYPYRDSLSLDGMSVPQMQGLALPNERTSTLIACVEGKNRSPRLTLATRFFNNSPNCIYLVGGTSGLLAYNDNSSIEIRQENSRHSANIRERTGLRRDDYYRLLGSSGIKDIVIVLPAGDAAGKTKQIITDVFDKKLNIEFMPKKIDLSRKLNIPLDLLIKNFPNSLE